MDGNGLLDHDLHNSLVPMNGSHSGSSGRSTPNNGGDPAPGKLFVGGLSWQTSNDKLREYFGMFGTVTDVLIMKDPITQVCILSYAIYPHLFTSILVETRPTNISLSHAHTHSLHMLFRFFQYSPTCTFPFVSSTRVFLLFRFIDLRFCCVFRGVGDLDL